jgi:hypothetical protein
LIVDPLGEDLRIWSIGVQMEGLEEVCQGRLQNQLLLVVSQVKNGVIVNKLITAPSST